MSFLYPRTISVYRNAASASAGLQPYSDAIAPTLVASGIPATIDLKKESGVQPAGLPGDTARRTYWNINFPGALGLVLDRDIIVDDLGQRYQVTGAYWTMLGYQVLAERLES